AFEPPNLTTLAVARDNSVAARHITIEYQLLLAAPEQVRIPVQRVVVQDRETLGDPAVVRQPRSRQRDFGDVPQAVVGIHDTVLHVRLGVGTVVEEEELAGALVHFGMCRDALEPLAAETIGADGLQRVWIETIRLAAAREHAFELAVVQND